MLEVTKYILEKVGQESGQNPFSSAYLSVLIRKTEFYTKFLSSHNKCLVKKKSGQQILKIFGLKKYRGQKMFWVKTIG